MKKVNVKEVNKPDTDTLGKISQKRVKEIKEQMKHLDTNSLYDKLEHRKLTLELESIKNNERLQMQKHYEKDGYTFVSNELTPYGKCIKVQGTLVRGDLKHLIDEKTMETFDDYNKSLKETKNKALEYVKEPYGFFVLLGPSGVGKTHLAFAMARELILKGHEFKYIKWVDMVSELSALDYRLRGNQINLIKREPLLMIDDLFWVEHNDPIYQFEKDYAMTILEYRGMNNLPTIITTNRTSKELRSISAGLAGRLKEFSRKYGKDNYIVVNEQDYREKI